MLKRLGRSRAAQETLAFLGAHYLRLVEATSRFAMEPADFRDRALADAPVIATVWHGQHLASHVAWPQGMKVAALISRNADAQANARALERLGVTPIRGSGGSRHGIHRRGGAAALREMLRTLGSGVSLVLTADVPKKARRCGMGVITLAKLSGRPIYPLAVTSARRIDFNSWDRASLPLPFSAGAIVVGEPLRVRAQADEAEMEAARLDLQARLDEVYARAYGRFGQQDPGAGLRAAREGAQSPESPESAP
jgi:lysophospholipid acyltransferase (LPLAT)-like uncharacterized protein